MLRWLETTVFRKYDKNSAMHSTSYQPQLVFHKVWIAPLNK